MSKSTSQDITNEIKNDPFIYNLFTNSSKSDFKIGRNVNWIKIPTSFVSEDGKESSISMLSVYTYSGEECKQISTSIKNPNDIVFSNEGHVAVSFAKNKTSAEFFYPNPIITSNTGGNTGDKPVGMDNTVGAEMKNFMGSFYFNEQVLFSKNLRWILYRLPSNYYTSSDGKTGWKNTKQKTSKTVPVYVLLYNPIHRSNFQDVYGKIINLTNDPFSTQSFVGPNTSYSTVIKKYCNAFKINKFPSPQTGDTLVHYADPACCIAFDTQVAKICQALSLNITKESLQKGYYHGGIKGYETATKMLNSIPSSDAYCSRGSGGGPSRYLRDKAKVVVSGEKTDSFMQILTNYEIATSSDNPAEMPSGWNSALPGDTTVGGTCSGKAISIVDCPITISTQGNLNMKGVNINPVCGGGGKSTIKKGSGSTSGTSGTSGTTSGTSGTTSGTSGTTSGTPGTTSGTSGTPGTPGTPPGIPPRPPSTMTPQKQKMYLFLIALVIGLILLGIFLFYKY